MAITDFAKEYHEKMFPGYVSKFMKTDPEFIERFDNFAFDEVLHMPLSKGQEPISDVTRHMAILAVLIGCQGIDEFKAMVPVAMEFGVSPVQIKEIVYQAVAYLGIGRVFPFLKTVNEIFESKGITLPLASQSKTDAAAEDDGVNPMSRRVAGTQAQVDIFGEGMKEFYKSGPDESRHINYWLADNCFGDYYTRGGLTLAERELVTFCYIYAQGGCEPQLEGHTAANFCMGNDKGILIQVISHCIPFIGYPRTLNALAVINKVAEEQTKREEKSNE